MKFGPVPVAEALDAILAHSLTLGGRRFKKGLRLRPDDIAALTDGGIAQVTVARLEPGDLGEDDAAERLAARLGADGLSVSAPFTGRANVHAEADGILRVNTGVVNALNRIDESVTLATLPDAARVRTRQMVATVKIIPYAVAGAQVAQGEALLGSGALELHPFSLSTARLILTQTPGLKPSLLSKAEASIRQRLDALGVDLQHTMTVPHTTEAVQTALDGGPTADLVLIFGASATSDRADACPSGLVAAGGTLERFGMPVDPGNLLFTGRLEGTPVIGLPGCARSMALNGADWVLERIVAGLEVGPDDIAAMGVGGLLKEIPSRPRPRQNTASALERPRVAALLLAAGASSRMGGRDKLLETVGDVPLLRHSAQTLINSQADQVVVVLSNGQTARTAALDGLKLDIVRNPLATQGMATSVRAGLAQVARTADAVIVALADMPDLTIDHINRLIAAFSPADGREIARAVDEAGTPGHPVLFSARFFESLAALEGDLGARSVIAQGREFLVDVPTRGLGATTDLDTPEAWATWRAGQANSA